MKFLFKLVDEEKVEEFEMGKHIIVILLIGLVSGGCAFDIAHVRSKPTIFTPQPDARKSFIINDAVQITQTPCGYERTLRQGTNWELAGTIPEGEVYMPRDQVLTVECSHVYEAYLVVSGDSLVGFYLPVEKEFVSISNKMTLPLEWKKEVGL